MPLDKPKLKTKLRDKTLELLQNRSIQQTFQKIEEDTGLRVDWLSKLSQGQIPDPSSNRIETLYEYLSGNPIQLP